MITAKRVGFADDTQAAKAAKRYGRFGLTGPGQQCLPIELPDGRGWAFWTAHNDFHPAREPGTLLFPRGEEVRLGASDDPESYFHERCDELARKLDVSLARLAEWLHDEIGSSRLRDYIYAPDDDFYAED